MIEELKYCTRCKTDKSLVDFYKDKSRKGGLQYTCKKCAAECHKKWREQNKERKAEYQKKYKQENKERRAEYRKKKRESDALFKLRDALRSRTYQAFHKNGYSKNTKTEDMLGAEWIIVKSHLELMFKEGMSWDNIGEWHIDHIIPLSSANTVECLIELCHYTNLQPLWANENISKGDKIIACRINI